MKRQVLEYGAVLSSSLIRAAAQWLLLLVFSRGGPQVVAEYATALAFVTPTYVVFSLGLRNVYITAEPAMGFSVAMNVRIVSLVLGGTGLIWGLVLWDIQWVDREVVLALLCLKGLDYVLDVVLAWYQRSGDVVIMAVAVVVNALAQLVTVAVAYLATDSVHESIWAATVSSAIVCIGFLLRPALHQLKRRGWRIWGDYSFVYRLGFPSGVAQGVNSLTTYLPVLFLGAWGSSRDVALFAVAQYFVTFANLLWNALQQAFLPRVVHRARQNQGRDILNAQLRWRAYFSGGMLGGLVLLSGPTILTLLYGPAFNVDFLQMAPIAAAIALTPSLFLVNVQLLVLNAYGLQARVACIALFVCAVVAVVLRDRFTVLEGALILFVGVLGRLIATGWFLRRLHVPAK